MNKDDLVNTIIDRSRKKNINCTLFMSNIDGDDISVSEVMYVPVSKVIRILNVYNEGMIIFTLDKDIGLDDIIDICNDIIPYYITYQYAFGEVITHDSHISLISHDMIDVILNNYQYSAPFRTQNGFSWLFHYKHCSLDITNDNLIDYLIDKKKDSEIEIILNDLSHAREYNGVDCILESAIVDVLGYRNKIINKLPDDMKVRVLI